MEAVQNGAKKRNLRGNQETKSGPGKFSFFSFHLDLRVQRSILTCFVNDLDLSKYVVNFNLSQASSESKPVKLVVSCVQ